MKATATSSCPYATMTGMMTMANGEVMPWSEMCPPQQGEERCDMTTAMMMLWNWQTINACFISEEWRIKTAGDFAGTCISVFGWGVLLQAFIRFLREFDRKLAQRYPMTFERAGMANNGHGTPLKSKVTALRRGPSLTIAALLVRFLRSVLHAVEFGGSYLFMLMAMYYNGYVLISMFIGQLIGYFIFSWDNVGSVKCHSSKGACC